MQGESDSASAPFLERKLATILSADVAEFSRLMGEDEEQTLKTFRGHKKVFESLVAMHHGRVFNTAGDAILAEFASAVEAVRCATDIQAALRTRNDQLPPSRQVRFRIGINLGDVMVHGQDLLGDGVNVAARLQTAAEPGGICISGSVLDQIRNKLSLSFHSLGEMNFKNIQQPVRTFSITQGESGGALPFPQPRGVRSGAAKWVAGGLLLLLAAGGYWAYTARERGKAEPARDLTAAPSPAVTPPEAAKPSSEPPATTPSQPIPNAAQPATEKSVPAASTARPVGAPETKVTQTPAHPALRAAAQPNAAAASAPSTAAAGAYDGVYSGQVCYGETPKFAARCYHAEGTLSGSKITGQWAMGHEDNGVTMSLAGDVGVSGEVRIAMHSTKADGSPMATINLVGTLHNGLINAQGNFLNGRPATLEWHKNSRASR